MKALFYIAIILFSISCHADYPKNTYVSDEVWEAVSPYFLLEDHPIKPQLEKIFSTKRITLNKKKLKKAGFEVFSQGFWSHVTIAKHKKLNGYVLKIYVDSEIVDVQDWAKWIERIEGAKAVRKAIKNHGFHTIFKVPHKWIYPLLPEPSPPNTSKYQRKNFILIAEDMNVYSEKKNRKLWKTSSMTKDKLDAIYTIVNEVGLLDVVYDFNLPFSKDGKLAFIDTELHHIWPIPFGRMTKYLTPPLQAHWRWLIANGGP